MTYDQVWWPILGICALHLTHPKCTHTAMNTHPEQWAAFYAVAPGEQLGVWCLAQRHLSHGIEVERALHIHSPHLQFLPARDLNLQPFNHKFDSLTIRPRLPPKGIVDLYGADLYSRLQTYKCITATYLPNGPLPLYLQSQLGVSMVHFRDTVGGGNALTV